MKWKSIFEVIPIFFSYYQKAKTIYQIHSPFLFEFIEFIFDRERFYGEMINVEHIYRKMERNNDIIPTSEHEIFHYQNGISVSEFLQKESSPLILLNHLFRISIFLKPAKILELGSGLGIGAMAFALAEKKSKIVAVESNSFFADTIKQTAEKNKILNIQICNQSFDHFLNENANSKFDFVFFHGEHNYSATIHYIKKIIPMLSENGVILMDDIHGSKEMYRAWLEISAWPEVRSSLETARWGFLFFRKTLNADKVTYIDYKWKPWKMGLFQ